VNLSVEHRNLFEFEILSLKGDFTHLNVYGLRKQVEELLEEKKKRFALDFSHVIQIDPAAIAVLHHLVRDIESAPGGVVFLFGASSVAKKQCVN